MSKLTLAIAAALDECVIENFADLYVMEDALKKLEKTHDFNDAAVLAGIARYADVACVQQRLIGRPPAVLAFALSTTYGMRPSAELLARALREGADLEKLAKTAPKPSKKPPPAFARAVRLPPPIKADGTKATLDEIDELVRSIAAAKLGEPPDASYTPESLAKLGRALALGWLSHCAEPKHVWGAHAAGHFPDDQTARDLGMMVRELAPRVGQFSKAQVLVDVLAAMNTRVALEILHELTKVKSRSVRDRAAAAFEEAAKVTGVSKHGLADKLIPEDAPAGRDFVKRLEQRMVEGLTMPTLEFIENILQRDKIRARARGVVFAAKTASSSVAFTIDDDGRLADLDDEDVELPAAASVIVVHPVELTPAQLKKWSARVAGAPFKQLDRPVHRFGSVRALQKQASALEKRIVSEGAVHGLEGLGWRRGPMTGGAFTQLSRELDGVAVELELAPGIYAGRGIPRQQRITSITAKGKGPPRALSEIARELATLAR